MARRKNKTFGQAERYDSITRELFREKLHCNGDTWLRNFDVSTESGDISRKVRRIVEKRMCQHYHRQNKRSFREDSNRARHNMKRAVSYELYILGQIEDTDFTRSVGTHWKRHYDPITGGKVYRQKQAYNTLEEAQQAVCKWRVAHPEDKEPIACYQCEHCGKYHLGHRSKLIPLLIEQEAC